MIQINENDDVTSTEHYHGSISRDRELFVVMEEDDDVAPIL